MCCKYLDHNFTINKCINIPLMVSPFFSSTTHPYTKITDLFTHKAQWNSNAIRKTHGPKSVPAVPWVLRLSKASPGKFRWKRKGPLSGCPFSRFGSLLNVALSEWNVFTGSAHYSRENILKKEEGWAEVSKGGFLSVRFPLAPVCTPQVGMEWSRLYFSDSRPPVGGQCNCSQDSLIFQYLVSTFKIQNSG